MRDEANLRHCHHDLTARAALDTGGKIYSKIRAW
jgi:hypothetical protein